jgi:uroporphyrinogen decarboxylase
MSAPGSNFVRACKGLPVAATPVWFMRQAGRYMPEYREVRRRHSLVEICKTPKLAAEVTITAAEALGVDAAIIFADLLLPLEVMGVPFRFAAGEGPVIEMPVRSASDIEMLDEESGGELGYVSESIRLVARHFGDKLPVIGFCGAPFTLASYMIEGGGSRQYVETKKFMYRQPEDWEKLLKKLVKVLARYACEQVQAGADVVQVFDSWVGCLSEEDYRRYVLPQTTELVHMLKSSGAPVIYFGTDTAMLLAAMKQTGADVIGVDWRIGLDQAWRSLNFEGGIQGNLDPVLLSTGRKDLRARTEDVLRRAGGRPGHIFNLGHGILPDTPVENVKAVVKFVHEYSSKYATKANVHWFGDEEL